MTNTQFRTSEGNLVAACNLSVGDEVWDYENQKAKITWCRIHPKEKVLLVDLYTKTCMLTVTGSHRVVSPGSLRIARDLQSGDEVRVGYSDSARCEKLVKATRRTANIRVVELQFEGDPTVAVCPPTILTKGSDPLDALDECGNVKEEPSDGFDFATDRSDDEGWQTEDEYQ